MLRKLAAGLLSALPFLALASCARSPAPTPVCTFEVSPAGHNVPAAGGVRSVNVTASQASCTWTIGAPSAPWITVNGDTSRTGSSAFEYTVAAHTGADTRTATIVAAGTTHTVTQSGQSPEPPPPTCDITLAPTSSTIGSGGGTGSFSVNVGPQCSWTATSDAAWLTIDTGSQGAGNGVVTYRAASNSANERTGNITVGDKVFSLRQSGVDTSACTYSVSAVNFSPCMAGSSVTTRVTTDPQCPWTATSTAPWLALDGATSRTGSGDVRLVFGDNYAPPRTGVVELRWPAATLGQNVRVAQAGCFYATSVNTISIGAAGGSSTFNVLQQAEPNACGGPLQDACLWTATATVPWITITTTMPVRGDNPVAFVVAANTGAQPRTGTITVQDRVVAVQQAGAQ